MSLRMIACHFVYVIFFHMNYKVRVLLAPL